MQGGGGLRFRCAFKALFTMTYAFALSAAAYPGQAARQKGYRFDSTCFVGNLWSIPMRIIRDDIPGFTPPGHASSRGRPHCAIAVELLTSFALICAIAIAAFAVSMEFAEAGALRSVHPSAHGVAATALLLLLLGTGALTASATIAPLFRAKPIRIER